MYKGGKQKIKEVLCYFWVFVLTSFLGFLVETLWCFLKYKKVESRKGVIYEPIIPIYGIAGVLILFVVDKFKLIEWYQLFLIGFIISTIVEFISSFLQEKIFATKSWDYSSFKLNFCGRVNLLYSILFGFVSLFSYEFVLKYFLNYYNNINIKSIFIILSILMLSFMLYDFIISSIAVYRMKERKRNIKRNNKFFKYIDNKYTDKYLKRVYPNMIDV